MVFYQPWYSMVTHYKYLTCAVRSVKSTATVIDWARSSKHSGGLLLLHHLHLFVRPSQEEKTRPDIT